MPFERVTPVSNSVAFTFEGRELAAEAGETLAAALIAAGVGSFRNTPVSGSDRGPWCLMGACFDCMVAVDGIGVQACMTPVRPGMVVTCGAQSQLADD